MPTAYTAMLEEDRKWDIKEWLQIDMVRAFGMFVHLRDSGGDYKTIEQLKSSFAKERNNPDDYCKQEWERSKAKLIEMVDKSDSEWDSELISKRVREQAKNKERAEEIVEKNKHYVETMLKLKNLLSKADTEANTNIVKMAISQLELCESEFVNPWMWDEFSTYESWQDYKKAKIEKCNKDIAYYQGEMLKEEERLSERERTYNDFLKFLDKHL